MAVHQMTSTALTSLGVGSLTPNGGKGQFLNKANLTDWVAAIWRCISARDPCAVHFWFCAFSLRAAARFASASR